MSLNSPQFHGGNEKNSRYLPNSIGSRTAGRVRIPEPLVGEAGTGVVLPFISTPPGCAGPHRACPRLCRTDRARQATPPECAGPHRAWPPFLRASQESASKDHISRIERRYRPCRKEGATRPLADPPRYMSSETLPRRYSEPESSLRHARRAVRGRR